MPPEFHIFFSWAEPNVSVRQDGLDDLQSFPSLGEATRHLRTHGGGGLVVLHDTEGESRQVNRIPLRFSV